MGKETSFGLWADVKPVDRLLLSNSYSYIHSNDLNTGERLFSQSIFRSRISFQMMRELSMRVVLQYHSDSWDIDPLITYRINSLTVFYIGSTHDYRDLNLADHGREGWTLTDRQFFMKIQYLFQL